LVFLFLAGWKSKYTLGWWTVVTYLGAENEHVQDQFTAAIGDFDTVVAFSQPERLETVKAERLVSFHISTPLSQGQNYQQRSFNRFNLLPDVGEYYL